MPKTLLLRLLRSSSTLLGLIVIALASSAILVQQREYRQDIAANDFLSQASQTSRNGVAEQLDDAMQQLGLGRTDGQNLPSSANSDSSIQFNEIELSLSEYFKEQRHATEQLESLTPLPPAVTEYLTQQQDISTVQQFILENPLPTWELQVAKLIKVPQQTTSFFPIANLQRLLLAQGIHRYEENPESAADSFEAAWQLTDAIAARPDLLSQMLSGILQQQQATLLRHIELPGESWQGEQWQARLERDQQTAILQALTFDRWAEYQTLQHQQAQSAVISSYPWQGFVGKQYLQFSRLDWLAARKRNQSELTQQQLCEMGTDAKQFPVKPNRLNAFGTGVVTLFAREWIQASDRMLAAELTQKVIQAKQLARTKGQWPKQLSQLNSEVCPQVAWNYEREEDGGIRIWFNQPAHWRVGMSGDFAPLSYEAEAFQAEVAPEPTDG